MVVQMLMLDLALLVVVVSAIRRADKEARLIEDSEKAWGLWWHVRMWVQGKMPAGMVASIVFAGAFPHEQQIGAFLGMGFTAMVVYWAVFDAMLALERDLDPWYISDAEETALTDKTLRWVQKKLHLSDWTTHLGVKLPLILAGVLYCTWHIAQNI